MNKRFAVWFLALALVLSTAGVVSAEGTGTGIVTVVHGVPGLTVDVYVNGAPTLPSFAPGTITDPIELPEGNYDIAIYPAGADPAATPPAISGSAFLPAGANASLVAHLAEDGTPTLSVFVNDTSPIARSDTRLVVRHTAAAPAVDIALYHGEEEDEDQYRGEEDDDDLSLVGVIEGLANPNEAQLDIPRGRYSATIAPAGSPNPVFGPARLVLRQRFTSTIVYAIGSLADGTFGLLIQKVTRSPLPSTTGIVTVVHGVPGLTVDVYVNGAPTLPSFAPGTITDPIELPEGNYDIAIYPAGADPAATPPAISGSAFLPAGANASLVAHLAEDGTPTLSVFVNDTSPIARSDTRLVVRHAAAAPAVDIALYHGEEEEEDDDDRSLVGVIEGLTNPNEAQLDIPRGKYSATIAPAGSPDPVFGPAQLVLRQRFTSTIVYAIGSLEGGSFQLLVQTLDIEGADDD